MVGQNQIKEENKTSFLCLQEDDKCQDGGMEGMSDARILAARRSLENSDRGFSARRWG